MRLHRVAVIIALALVFVEFCESRGSRGGSRGGSRSGSRSRSNSRSRSRSSGGGSASKPKITKYTPIKATSRTTPVIVSQTKRGSRTYRNVLVGYIAYRYAFSRAPVYRHGYPMCSRSVAIPEESAVRIMFTETKMLNNNGNFCLNGTDQQETRQNISEGASKNVIEVNMTIQYGNEKPDKFDGIDKNFMLRKQEGVNFKIVSRTQYNTTLVQGENCTVVEEHVDGTVILLYETNPDGASTVAVSAWLSPLTVLLVASFSFGR